MACGGRPKGPERSMLDSGASFHIISRKDLTTAQCESIETFEGSIEIETVNGTISNSQFVSLSLPGLWDRVVKAIVVEESPATISLGRMRMLDGFEFSWKGGRCPTLKLPNGHNIPLQIDEFVPHVHHKGAERLYAGATDTNKQQSSSSSCSPVDGIVTSSLDPEGSGSNAGESELPEVLTEADGERERVAELVVQSTTTLQLEGFIPKGKAD